MSVCKICLCSDPENDITELKSTENGVQSGKYILLFCLGIQVVEDSGNNTKFCERCFSKLAEFYLFKSLALKNEATISSLGLQKYIETTIKSEVVYQTSYGNDYDEPLIDYSILQEEKSLEKSPTKDLFRTHGECSIVTDLDTRSISKLSIKPELLNNEFLSSKKIKNTGITKTKRSRNILEQVTNTPVTCDLCGKHFKSKHRLVIHLKTHEPIELRKTFECAHCIKTFTKKNPLETHIIRSHPEHVSLHVMEKKKLQCNICLKSYYNRKNLQIHINTIHAGCKPQCPMCNKHITEMYLQTHIRTKHQPDSLPFKCDRCDRKFVRESLLKRHVSVHTGVKPFSCDICDAKFRLKYSVALHKAEVHEKSKNHVCHICSKRYFTGSRLQRHIRNHSKAVNYVPGERPGTLKKEIVKKVTCPDCGKPLASLQSMKNHRLLHKGQQYYCQICGLAFATRNYVLNHMKTHTQERKFGCKFCDAKFLRSSARRRHELDIHIKAGEKKPPRKDKRKNRSRKKVKEPNPPTVIISVPGQPNVPGAGVQILPIFPISGPFKTEDKTRYD